MQVIMTAKEYLNRGRRIQKSIIQKQERMEMLRSMAERSTSSINALRSGGTDRRSKLEDAVILLQEKADEIAEEIQAQIRVCRSIENVIDAVPEPRYRELLRFYYLNFLTWDEVAVRMGWSVRHTLREHGEALSTISIP